MDAIEFIKEYRRMCKKYAYMDAWGEDCSNECALYSHCDLRSPSNLPEYIVSKVEQWSQDHPQKTMIQDFFEKFPNAPKEEDGTPIDICPSYCGYTDEPNSLALCEKFNKNCLKCWSRPLED